MILKNFADHFAGVNDVPTADSVQLPQGGRAYPRTRFGQEDATPYFDEVHFDIHDESWYRQYALRDLLAADTERHGAVYAGCAGTMNLDYMAAMRVRAAVLFDINPLQHVFWGAFLKTMAATPDRQDFARKLPAFTGGLYYKLADVFGAAAIGRNASPPNPAPDEPAHMRHRDWRDRYSPFRGMRYGRMESWAETRARDEKHWLGDDAKYAHLRALAQNNAVAAVTVDIRDTQACALIGERLQRAGVSVDFLYRSNVGHYLRWSAAEIAAQKAKGDTACDFTGKTVDTGTYRRAHDNVRRWMAADSLMIAADRHTGGAWGQFVPQLRRIKGLG